MPDPFRKTSQETTMSNPATDPLSPPDPAWSLVIEAADAEPRPLCTPAERLGMILVIYSMALLIVTLAVLLFVPLVYLGAAFRFGWPVPPRRYAPGMLAVWLFGAVLAYVHDKLFVGVPRRLYLGWRTARILGRRPQRIVSPGEPGAFFVQVVPRERWPIPMMEDATDRGWFAVDRANARLLFEGVRERWKIPASCLEACSRFEFQGSTLNVYVILVVRDADRIVEIPLRTMGPGGATYRDQDKRRDAAALLEAVESLKAR
jgi:hypothetical protein